MTDTVASLLSADAVRTRARMILEAGRADRLAHFVLHEDRLHACADFVAATIRRNYPTLRVPPHARWRHFVVDGEDRWRAISRKLDVSTEEYARIRIELAIVSVLLDAGAGPRWLWRDPASGKTIARSEGLALASLTAYCDGAFSSDRDHPLRVDAGRLRAMGEGDLVAMFGVTADNPLEGLDGRVALLERLGVAITDREFFPGSGRLGNFYDLLVARSEGAPLAAPAILFAVLEALGPIWPGRLTIDGIDLGDTWRHPAIDVPGPTRGLIPFHKLSQWLTYSLIEPLEEAGIRVTDLDGLTGLAEYRNGGLFIDSSVLVPRDPDLAKRPLAPGDEPIVEWRALTVALLARIAPLVRQRLGTTAAEMPLASILEGGTWAAGRRIAREKRVDGGPPLTIVSDGSVF